MTRCFLGTGTGVHNGTRKCTSLLCHLTAKGFSPEETNRMVKDVFNVIREGASFAVSIVNTEMEALGRPPSVMDEGTFEMIVGLFERELGSIRDIS
jgi:hypothetical protein